MFFFNWNDPNKNTQDDGNGAAPTDGQANGQVTVQPANDFLEPTQPMQTSQSLPQQPPAPQQPTDYVDAYTPPSQNDQAHLKHTPWNADQDVEDVQAAVDQQVSQAVEPSQDELGAASTQSTKSDQSAGSEAGQTEEADQSLESQNIFDLLGAADGEDSEKEAFLDELQQVVWEDFVQNDVQTILTEAEFAEFSQIVNQSEIANEEMQEKALEYLEKVVPDLEDILLEKALQLKEDLVWERVAGMKEYFAGKDQQLQAVVQAEALFKQDRWDDGAQLLNTLS